jgi:hypothetical protein
MNAQIDIEKIDHRISILKKAAEELAQMGDEFPALKRNTARILASIKMLEINVSDIIDL